MSLLACCWSRVIISYMLSEENSRLSITFHPIEFKDFLASLSWRPASAKQSCCWTSIRDSQHRIRGSWDFNMSFSAWNKRDSNTKCCISFRLSFEHGIHLSRQRNHPNLHPQTGEVYKRFFLGHISSSTVDARVMDEHSLWEPLRSLVYLYWLSYFWEDWK